MAARLGDEMTPIHHVTASEIQRASQVLARAFRNDPLASYLSPAVSRRESLLRRFYRWLLRYGVRYGEVHATSDDLEGAAVWLPPEDGRRALLRMARAGALLLPLTVGPRFFLRSWRYSRHVGGLRLRYSPFPHWFLQLLGVDPDCRRHGHATQLLRSMLERLDRAKMACCLDTANRGNLGFYGALGFRVAAESRLPGTNVDCWLMVRRA